MSLYIAVHLFMCSITSKCHCKLLCTSLCVLLLLVVSSGNWSKSTLCSQGVPKRANVAGAPTFLAGSHILLVQSSA
ncbi:hypothetical protein Bpfe_020891, partial [Biomphalaria pfeifferi]